MSAPYSAAPPPATNIIWFTLFQDQTENEQFQLLSGGQPFNLTGCGVERIVLPSQLSTTVLASFSTLNGTIQLVNPVAGIAQFNIPAAVASLVPAGSWYHVSRVVLPLGGGKYEWGRGPFLVLPGPDGLFSIR